MSSELFSALKALESEKGISFTVLVEAVEAALVAAYQKNFNKAQNVRVDFNVETGETKVFAKKEVKEEVVDERLHISLEEAKAINGAYEIDDVVEFEVTPRDFGRVAAQAAKQLIVQRVREAERGIIYDEFIDRQEDIITGVVQRKDAKNYHVQIGRTEAILPVTEILPNEKFEINQKLNFTLQKLIKQQKVRKSKYHVQILAF